MDSLCKVDRFGAWTGILFSSGRGKIHPGKTRLIEFGHYAASNRQRRGQGKPETFDFLGFTHICGKTRKGAFMVLRKTMKTRQRDKLQELKSEFRRRLHDRVPDIGNWLTQVVRGYFQYHGIPMNLRALESFRHQVVRLWCRSLRRRSQKHRCSCLAPLPEAGAG